MPGRVRNHRRASGFIDGLGTAGLIVLFCGGGPLLLILLGTLGDALPGIVSGSLLVGGILGFLVLARWRLWRAKRARRVLAGWAGPAGWRSVPAEGPWPWTVLQAGPDLAVVLSAYTKQINGFTVSTGEIRWHNLGLGTTVGSPAGSGLFVLVVLPQAVESMAVRGYHDLPRRRIGEDEFLRRFETRGFDSYRLDNPELRAAHVNGDVPLWTVIGRDLFAFVPLDGPAGPADVDLAVERTLRVVRLMELGPDGPVPLGGTGPPAITG